MRRTATRVWQVRLAGAIGVARGAAAIALLALLSASTAFAQQDKAIPPRPTFDRRAVNQDQHDWRAYFDCGFTVETKPEMRACFYWASRLEPSRPEPLYAAWRLSDDKDTLALSRALRLDPFIIDARVRPITQPRAGYFTSPESRGWSAMSAGDYFAATKAFDVHLAREPDDLDARIADAIALYYRAMYDSSVAQLGVIEQALRARGAAHLARRYRPLSLIAYMQGVADAAGGRGDRAREALQRALTEDLTFYQARMLLADLELAAGDTAGADADWTQVRELSTGDVVARRRYATFLLQTGRPADAERELRGVIEAEPRWAAARFDLAVALAAQGGATGDMATSDRAKHDGAIRAFEDFLALAPASATDARRAAGDRLAALRAP